MFEQEDTKLFESRAICRYLLAKYKSPLALPHDLVDLGLFEQADSVGYSYFDPAIENLAYESIFKRCVIGENFKSSSIFCSPLRDFT